jgi:hypothetical protein
MRMEDRAIFPMTGALQCEPASGGPESLVTSLPGRREQLNGWIGCSQPTISRVRFAAWLRSAELRSKVAEFLYWRGTFRYSAPSGRRTSAPFVQLFSAS